MPVLDLSLGVEECAAVMDEAFRRIGFLYVKNHGVSKAILDDTFALAKEFHELEEEVKLQYAMDDKGVGYLPYLNRKLPARDKPNMNAAFIMKQEPGPRSVAFDHTKWPKEVNSFQRRVTAYVDEMKRLSNKLLRVVSVALSMDENTVKEYFQDPMFRLRLSHYPKATEETVKLNGIGPHVDTTFFTILAASDPGLVCHNAKSDKWMRLPYRPDALVLNSGQFLRQFTNDTWCATRHYAAVPTERSRYSIPYFFNATPYVKLPVAPSCVSATRPARYEPQSYLESAGMVQGE